MVWTTAGIPTPRFEVVDGGSDWAGVAKRLGLPLIIKPAREGSTIGLTKVTAAAQLPGAYALASRHDPFVMAEEFIAGEELTAGFLGDQALPLIRIEAPQGNYDYQNKYFSDETKYHCPCGLPEAEELRIRAMVMKSAQALGCAGWGRADLIRRADGSVQFLEMNTSPGMTGHSLVPMAARQAGLSFDDLVLRILGMAHVG
jgi:D-alanine-D-alanine ligase